MLRSNFLIDASRNFTISFSYYFYNSSPVTVGFYFSLYSDLTSSYNSYYYSNRPYDSTNSNLSTYHEYTYKKNNTTTSYADFFVRVPVTSTWQTVWIDYSALTGNVTLNVSLGFYSTSAKFI